MGTLEEDKLSLADFQFSEKGEVVACPRGSTSAKDKIRKKSASVLHHRIVKIALTCRVALSKKGKIITIFASQINRCA